MSPLVYVFQGGLVFLFCITTGSREHVRTSATQNPRWNTACFSLAWPGVLD